MGKSGALSCGPRLACTAAPELADSKVAVLAEHRAHKAPPAGN